MVVASAALVVHVAPTAGGSGVPEMMAFLNGVHLPKVFNINTLLVKFLSCALAVGSGLPVGPEGPMIHIVRFVHAPTRPAIGMQSRCCLLRAFAPPSGW
jgi:chloride channel 7